VSKRLFKPPKDLIAEWPEVFEGMYMNTMPVSYMLNVVLEFKDGRIWEIDVKNQLADADPASFSQKLLEVLEEYGPSITKIDLKFDIDKLKSDIKKSTRNIL
jgi:hypothetical protein